MRTIRLIFCPTFGYRNALERFDAGHGNAGNADIISKFWIFKD